MYDCLANPEVYTYLSHFELCLYILHTKPDDTGRSIGYVPKYIAESREYQMQRNS